MPDGLVIERLPVGLANREWHLSFVCSGVDFFAGSPRRADRFHQDFRDRVTVTGVGADLEWAHGGSDGGDTYMEFQESYAQNGVTAIAVSYLHDGGVVADEVLALTLS